MRDRHRNLVFIALLLVISSLYIFYNYREWLTSSCIAPVGADIKFHVATVHIFIEQIKSYGLVYPVDFIEDAAGFYWYIRSPIPIILPAIASIFTSFNAAFFLIFILAYVAVVLSLYMFIKNITDSYTAFFISIFFLFSSISNMPFSVGGNYQFFLGLIFFFLSCNYFYLYLADKKRKHFIMLFVTAILLGLTYTFSLIFLLVFAALQMLLAKRYKNLLLLFPIVLTLGTLLVPMYVTNSYIEPSQSRFPTLPGILKTYILPTSLTGWIYQSQTPYTGNLDFNQGIQIYLIGLIFILLLFIKERTQQYLFVQNYLLTMVLWLLLGFLTLIIPLGPITNLLTGAVPLERLMYHVYLAFLFVAAYGIKRFNVVHWKSLIPVTAVGMLALGTKFLTSKLFFALIAVYAVFIFRDFVEKKESKKELLISSILVYLLIFPLSGKVETTNLEPRPAFMNLDGIDNYIKPNEIFYFKGGWSLEQIIISCAKARGTIQIDRDKSISKLNDEIDVLNPSLETKNKIELRGINKIVIALDQILDNDKVDPNKISHLVGWYGEPKVFQLKNYYPFIIFETNVKERVKREMESPVLIHFPNPDKKDSFLTDLEYHPWWSAYDDNTRLEIKNSDGLIEVLNTSNVQKVTMKFSLKYFILGALVSLLGIIMLIVILKKKFYNSG